jgi:hypothetical protein
MQCFGAHLHCQCTTCIVQEYIFTLVVEAQMYVLGILDS